VNDPPRSGRTRLAVAGARSATLAGLEQRPRAEIWRGQVFHAFLLLMVSLALIGLALLLIDAAVDGRDRFGIGLFTDQTGATPEVSGFQNAILGTLLVIAGVIVMTVPLGVGAAIYLEEYADKERWWNRLIELNIQNLAAVPSIVYGILGLAFLVRGFADLGQTVLAGGLTLSLLVLPIVIISSREAIRAVPDSIRQGSLALGATQWQTIRRQILPAAIPGIATGTILALSRAIGEAAPLVLLGALTFITFNP
jgi:phosphate transport system permease protein